MSKNYKPIPVLFPHQLTTQEETPVTRIHALTYDTPAHRTAYIRKTFFPRKYQSGTAFFEKSQQFLLSPVKLGCVVLKTLGKWIKV